MRFHNSSRFVHTKNDNLDSMSLMMLLNLLEMLLKKRIVTSDTYIDNDFILISLDVISLFTNILIDMIIESVSKT